MTQSIAIMVLGNPFSSPSAQTALEYSHAVLEAGYSIERLFFYHDAVQLGTVNSVASQDEINLPEAWQAFIASNDLDAVVCIASAIKRGILDEREAKRHEKPAICASEAMEISGLGQWIEAVNMADQHIVFGY